MEVVAVVLAAGRGARMGGPKALLRIEADTFLARAARLVARPGVSAVLAVVGHDADRVAAEAALPDGVALVRNGRPEDGMLSSLLCGLDAAEARGADAVLVHPVDHPLVAAETVDRVVAALAGGAWIAVPSFGGRRGHPGGFARPAWAALRAADRGQGARAVLQEHPDWIVHVPGDPGCVAGVNDPGDYRRLVERHPPE
jgi:CTP:molybdopterin cytidylyltransferase MocA